MKKIIFCLTFLIMIPISFGILSVNIDMKDSFNQDELVSFEYTLLSDADTEVVFIPILTCPGSPTASLQEKRALLKANEPLRDTHTEFTVDENIEPQTCTAYVQILSPIKMVEEKKFTINTNPSFNFDIKTCKDQSCTEKSKIFLNGENINLNFDASVENPTITATLTYPDKTTKQITLPTSIKAEQIGTYNLEITASKEGYKTITKKEQFAVIEEEAEFEFVGVCNANGVCENKENYQNCPQDCIFKKGVNTILIIGALVIIAIIFIFIFIRRRNKIQF